MNWYQYFWVFWGVAFLVVEFTAIFSRVPMATLSEQIWYLRAYHHGWFSLLMAVLGWAIYHFCFEVDPNNLPKL